MNAGLAHTIESLFGPPSEPVDITSFINAAVEVESRAVSYSDLNSQSDGGLSNAVAAECSVSDLRDTLFHIWNNPKLSAHLSKDHEHKINALYATTKSAKPKRKANLLDPDSLSPEVTTLQRHLDDIKLSGWKLQADSVLFMRSPKNSDQNILAQVKATSDSPFLGTATPHAIITFSVHNRLTWGAGYVMRASQHALRSSHTLEDLFKVIPCTSNELGGNNVEDERVSQRNQDSDCVICIEGVAYGRGGAGDYADKFLMHLKTISKGPPTMEKSTRTIHDIPIAALSLRINQPYWLLHQGNCEHFIVIDQIRFQHPSDASLGYPLTLQITPPLLDLCRICVKVPAVLSVVGDVRLGESPCLMCDPCWRVMGGPSPDSGAVVKSLPRYELEL